VKRTSIEGCRPHLEKKESGIHMRVCLEVLNLRREERIYIRPDHGYKTYCIMTQWIVLYNNTYKLS
jgi:hypothetical protein